MKHRGQLPHLVVRWWPVEILQDVVRFSCAGWTCRRALLPVALHPPLTRQTYRAGIHHMPITCCTRDVNLWASERRGGPQLHKLSLPEITASCRCLTGACRPHCVACRVHSRMQTQRGLPADGGVLRVECTAACQRPQLVACRWKSAACRMHSCMPEATEGGLQIEGGSLKLIPGRC